MFIKLKTLKIFFISLSLSVLFFPTLILARTNISIALDKKKHIYLLSHSQGILYKIDSYGKLITSVSYLQNKDRKIPIDNISFFSSDSFGNIYAFNYEAIEILKINDDLKIEKNWFINFNITSLPSLTIGSNNKIYVYLPLIGIVEYSSEGKILKQVLNDPACIDKYETISIGARGKITANNGNNIFLWFTKQGKSKAFSFNMDTEQCKRENIGEYINFMAFDKKSRVVVMAPSWIFVTGFFELKGNSAIYPKSLSPEAIVIDNLNNYYIYNLDMNEILVIKDTGKINRIIKLDSSIVIK